MTSSIEYLILDYKTHIKVEFFFKRKNFFVFLNKSLSYILFTVEKNQ